MGEKGERWEELRVAGDQLVGTLRKLVREGNVRRIVVKDEQGRVFLEIPLTVGAVGAVLVPLWAALGTLAALVSGFRIEIQRTAAEAAEEPLTESAA